MPPPGDDEYTNLSPTMVANMPLKAALALIRRGQESGELSPDVSPRWVNRTLDALIRAGLRASTDGEMSAAEAAELIYRTTLRGIAGEKA